MVTKVGTVIDIKSVICETFVRICALRKKLSSLKCQSSSNRLSSTHFSHEYTLCILLPHTHGTFYFEDRMNKQTHANAGDLFRFLL